MVLFSTPEPVQLLHGDCREQLRQLPDASVDAVVTDPPYELGFMGKSWDSSGVAFDVTTWAECLRVLKPGGHLLAFCGTRTYHRMVVAIEDAGFEVRDQLQWLYGSGFPKSLDVSKAIDKAAGAEREVVGTVRKSVASMGPGEGNPSDDNYQWQPEFPITAPAPPAARRWQGWGTALKPANEPICLARKPLEGTVAANVLAHGTGALNIDGCRIHTAGSEAREYTTRRQAPGATADATGAWRTEDAPEFTGTTKAGRWPANVLLDEEAAAALDAQSGTLTSGTGAVKRATAAGSRGNALGAESRPEGTPMLCYGDSGGASRFYYVAKPSKAERSAGLEGQNVHPTVKPIALMAYLCRLVTPPGGVVLDPFLGSGTTGCAAMREGFRFVGVEQSAEYLDLARRRIDHAAQLAAAAAAVEPEQMDLL